jgi:DNA-binding IclR family transcriptional regulator
MTEPDPNPFSAANIAMLKRLARRGCSIRIGALARETAVPTDDLCETLNTLMEWRWLEITLRRRPDPRLPARLSHVHRVTLTRLGRARLPVKCVLHPPRLSRRRRHPRPGR